MIAMLWPEVGGRAGQAKIKGNSCDDSKEIYQKVWLEYSGFQRFFFSLISNSCKFEAILPGYFISSFCCRRRPCFNLLVEAPRKAIQSWYIRDDFVEKRTIWWKIRDKIQKSDVCLILESVTFKRLLNNNLGNQHLVIPYGHCCIIIFSLATRRCFYILLKTLINRDRQEFTDFETKWPPRN